MFDFSEDEWRNLVEGIYEGTITPMDLPENLYNKIVEVLRKGTYDGYGITLDALKKGLKEGVEMAFDETDLQLLTELRESIYFFSAAKTFQQIVEMSDALINEDGEMASFKEFEETAESIFDTYNENWLETEYNTAISSAQSAVRWNNIEKNKETLPLLKFSAVIDDHTTEECEDFEGIVLPVDDPFWDSYMPPNHFNCRSTVEQLEEDEEKTTPDDEVEEAIKQADVPEEFRFNPGKTGAVFSEEHAYYDVDKQYREYAANNFNMPIPEKDKP